MDVSAGRRLVVGGRLSPAGTGNAARSDLQAERHSDKAERCRVGRIAGRPGP